MIIKNPFILSIDFKSNLIREKISYFYDELNQFLYNKDNEKKIIIIILIGMYIFLANRCNYFANKITNNKFYEMLFMNKKEMEFILKQKLLLSIEDIIHIKKLYNNIDHLFYYYYLYLFFAFIPFFHNDLKYIVFNMNSIIANLLQVKQIIQER